MFDSSVYKLRQNDTTRKLCGTINQEYKKIEETIFQVVLKGIIDPFANRLEEECNFNKKPRSSNNNASKTLLSHMHLRSEQVLSV